MSNPDRKWFVYSGVQQEGPLSLDEVRGRLYVLTRFDNLAPGGDPGY